MPVDPALGDAQRVVPADDLQVPLLAVPRGDRPGGCDGIVKGPNCMDSS